MSSPVAALLQEQGKHHHWPDHLALWKSKKGRLPELQGVKGAATAAAR